MKIEFTEKALDELIRVREKSGKRQLKVFDASTPGFAVVVGTTSTIFIANIKRDDGTWRQETIGHRGDMTLAAARKTFKVIAGNVADNKLTQGDILRLSHEGPTVREAVNDYISAMENRQCRWSSIDSVRRELLIGPHLQDWLDRPLRSIKPGEVRKKHEKIGISGKASANRIIRNFCSVWQHIASEAMMTNEGWPQNPRPVVRWYKIDRRRDPLPWSALPAWKTTVDAIENFTRRNFQYMVLFTGLRRTDAFTLRWEHVNLTDAPIEAGVWDAARKKSLPVEIPPGSMHRPFPKGGETKAFTIPLPTILINMLREQKKMQNCLDRNDLGWVFPAKADKSGPCSDCAELGLPDHVQGTLTHMLDARCMTKRRREILGVGALPSPHRLRDTYLSATPLLEPPMPEDIAQALVNHRPRTVTQGYRRIAIEDLRMWQEKQCAYLLQCMRGERHLSLVA